MKFYIKNQKKIPPPPKPNFVTPPPQALIKNLDTSNVESPLMTETEAEAYLIELNARPCKIHSTVEKNSQIKTKRTTLKMAKIVLASNELLGDIYPFLGLGLGLKAKGHDVTFASMEHYRTMIETHGLFFKPIRPEIPLFDPEL